VGEDAEGVVHFFWAVDAYGDANAVDGEEIDDLRGQERGVGGQAEIDFYISASRLFIRIVDDVAQQREIHEGFAAEEGDVNGFAAFGLGEQVDNRGFAARYVNYFLVALCVGDGVWR